MKHLKLCGNIHCNNRIEVGKQPAYCNECISTGKVKLDTRAYSQFRASASDRGYDREWFDFAKRYLEEHKLCENCEEHGVITQSQEVHHIHPIKDGGLMYDRNNLMALCCSCHRTIDNQLRRDRAKRCQRKINIKKEKISEAVDRLELRG